jgi:hypothetical protein
MATLRQITANRRNAQCSTGPRTGAGKALTRFNALKHGIDAKSQCLPQEDPNALAELGAEYHERFAPATPEERALVDVLISAEWDLRRYRAASAQLWQWASLCHIRPSEAERNLPIADGFIFEQRVFSRLQRHIDATQRNYRQTLRDLLELQSLREDSIQPQETKPETEILASFRKSPAPSPAPVPAAQRQAAPPPSHPAEPKYSDNFTPAKPRDPEPPEPEYPDLFTPAVRK